MKKDIKQPRKDVNQQAKQVVDFSIEKLNKSADTYQEQKKLVDKNTKDKQ